MGSGGSKDGRRPGKGGGAQPAFGVEGVKLNKSDAKDKKPPQTAKKIAAKPTVQKGNHKTETTKATSAAETTKATSAPERRSKEDLEEFSIEQQMAQQYKQYEARQKLSEDKQAQEDMSLEMMAAQKYKAYEEEQRKQKMLEDQEEMSLEQQAIQQYKAFAAAQNPLDRQSSVQKALLEADNLLDAYGPPPAKPKKDLELRFFPDSGSQEERNAISCIVPGKLYLTNFRGVEKLEELESLGIKHIVCVNEQENEFAHKFNYFNIDNLEDQEDHDAMQHFESVAKFTDQALADGGAVCFHCAAGISRSSTMMISYLMKSRKMSLYDAFAMTYKARRVTWPNRTFMQQLIEYERQLQSKGMLSGKGPSITLQQWDMWTAGDEGQVSDSCFVRPYFRVIFGPLQHRASKEACLQDRSASLRGKETVQFLAFKDAFQKELSHK